MAKVKIQGHASGTGVLTVTAPNTSTDRTITLPDSTGELLSTAGGTMTGDLILGDDVSLEIGSGTNGDLQLYHSGGHNTIDSKTGDLVIRTDALRMYNQANNEALIKGDADGEVQLFHNGVEKFNTTSAGVTVTGSVDGADNLVEEVASGATAALSHDGTASATVYAVTGTHTTYLVTASANSSITNVVALVSIGTSTSTMRITNLSGSYNTTVTGSGSNIQVTCAFGSSLVYQYRVIKLR